MSGAPRGPRDDVESLAGRGKRVIQELESYHGVHKETACSLTQQIEVLISWPNASFDASSFREFGQPMFQEKSDIRVDGGRFHPVKDEDVS